MVEQRPFKALVAGSSPAQPTPSFPYDPPSILDQRVFTHTHSLAPKSTKKHILVVFSGTLLGLNSRLPALHIPHSESVKKPSSICVLISERTASC